MTTRGVAIWLVNFLHKWPYSKTKVSLGSGVFLRWQRQQDQNSLEDVGKQVRLNKSVSKKRSWCRQFPENYVHEWHSNDCFVEKLQRRRRKTTGRVAKTEEISNKYCIKGAFCLPSRPPWPHRPFKTWQYWWLYKCALLLFPFHFFRSYAEDRKTQNFWGLPDMVTRVNSPSRSSLALIMSLVKKFDR